MAQGSPEDCNSRLTLTSLSPKTRVEEAHVKVLNSNYQELEQLTPTPVKHSVFVRLR